MRKLLTRSILLGTALFAGCYSMDVATTSSLRTSALSPDDAMPKEHIVVANYGWYLFNWIPLVCGNAKPGSLMPWSFFSNEVSTPLLHDRMMSRAAATDSDVRDLVFFRDETVIFTFPGTNFPIPIPYVLTYREIQFSGVLTHKTRPKPDRDSPSKAVDEMKQLLDKLNPEDAQ